MSIHNRFKQLRSEQKLTQNEFASRLGVARSSISSIESGSSNPGPRLISDICEVFGVNKQWLETGDGDTYYKKEQDEFAFLVGKIAIENDDFKKRFITSVLKLDDNGWDVIQQLVEDIAQKKD